MRHFFWLFWRFPAVLLVATSLVGCEKNEFIPPPPPQVTVAFPVAKRVTEVVEFTGVSRAVDSVEVRARVQGFVSRIPMQEQEGKMVSAGDLLMEIDPRPFAAQLAGAEAAWEVAKANVTSALATVTQAEAQADNAKSQFDRAKRASRNGAVTQAELDDLQTDWQLAVANIAVAKAKVESAKAGVAVAKAERLQAQLDYDYTQVTAPIAGRLGQRYVDLGALVGSGEPTLLTEVINYNPIYVYFTVSETDYEKHLREEAARGRSGAQRDNSEGRKVLVGLSGEQGFPHQGRIDFADLKIDSGTGTFLLRAVLENPDWLIRPGAFTRVQIPLEPRDVLLVEETAVQRDQAGYFVLVLGEEDIVKRQPISVGRVIDGQRVITEGLSVEDQVVVNGVQRARPGMKVEPNALTGSGQ